MLYNRYVKGNTNLNKIIGFQIYSSSSFVQNKYFSFTQ